jgi:alpha-L-rhamnosidase
MYALAFGLVPVENQKTVIDFIKSRRMACGVYSSNYLLEAMFDYGQAEYAMSLITDTSDRSWLNMIHVGATMTTEAWDNKYKVNNGWSHAWSAAPVHILPRKLIGIEPLEAGFGKISIRPQPAGITEAKTKIPTIRGDIEASYKMEAGKSFELNVSLPANTIANIYLPALNGKCVVKKDGKALSCKVQKGYFIVKKTGSGKHQFRVECL